MVVDEIGISRESIRQENIDVVREWIKEWEYERLNDLTYDTLEERVEREVNRMLSSDEYPQVSFRDRLSQRL